MIFRWLSLVDLFLTSFRWPKFLGSTPRHPMRLLLQCLRQGSEAWSVTEDHGGFEEGLDRFFDWRRENRWQRWVKWRSLSRGGARVFGKILKRRCRFQLAGGRLPIWAKCFMGSQLDCREFWLLHRIVAIGVTLQDYEWISQHKQAKHSQAIYIDLSIYFKWHQM